MSYEIELEDFRGPFEMLFELIEKERIDIYNIPIHKITADFIQKMNTSDIPASEISDFILFASILLEIKSKMLLPDAQLEPIDIDNENDPRHHLLIKLLEYKKIREVGYFLTNREARFRYQTSSDDMVIKLPEMIEVPLSMEVHLLQEAFRKILERASSIEKTEDHLFFKGLKRESFSVSKSQKAILKLLRDHVRVLFTDLFHPDEPKAKWIANFLALLKLQQQGNIRLKQAGNFEELSIEGRNV